MTVGAEPARWDSIRHTHGYESPEAGKTHKKNHPARRLAVCILLAIATVSILYK